MSYDGGCGDVDCELCKADAEEARKKWEAGRRPQEGSTIGYAAPVPSADDVALREMAAWLKAHEDRQMIWSHGHANWHLEAWWEQPRVRNRNDIPANTHRGASQSTIADAWAALKRSAGWPG